MTKAELITKLVNLDCPDDTLITMTSKCGEYDFNLNNVTTHKLAVMELRKTAIALHPGD